MRMTPRYFVLILTFLLGGTVFNGSASLLIAQDVSFTAQAEKVLRAGEQFQLVYNVNQSVDNFSPPDFGEFRYLGGPMQGSSQSFSMVNGKTTRSVSYTYTYYLQAPSEAGKYTLNPATATFKRNTIESNSLEIEVVGSSSAGSGSSTSQSTNDTKSATEVTSGDNIFVRLELDKRSLYQGDQVTAWVKLYTKLNVADIENLKMPDFVGFYKQEVDIPTLKSLERESVGDDIYYTGVLNKMILYPQRSGEVTIDPLEMTVIVQEQSRRQSRSLIDEFFGPQYNHKRVVLKSKPVKLSIKPLPANKPADFSGAVGQFEITARASTNETVTNDAVTFRINISGKGNFKLIEGITTQFPPTFDVFEPVKDVNVSAGGRSGSVSFEYTAIPRHEGTFRIPPFKLSYFDPSAGSYKTLSSEEFTINVARGEGDSSAVMVGNLSREDVQLLGSDIRYIQTQTNLRPRGYYFFGTPLFIGLYALILSGLIVFLIIRREQIKRNADAARYRNRKAGRTAAKRLKLARKILQSNNKEAFFEELGKALWNYLSDKLSIPISELSRENVQTEFERRGVDIDLKEQFFSVVDACEFARFAPGGRDSEMEEMYEKAAKLIGKIDQKL